MSHRTLVILLLFVMGCTGPVDEASYQLEASPEANWFASQHEGVAPPVAFGFEPVETAELPRFPRWYCPTSIVTRAQLASFIVRATRGASAPRAQYSVDFSDVPTASVHYADIAQVVRDGTMMGCGEDAFCAEHGVTRGQMATYLMRLRHGPEFEPQAATGSYLDVDAHHLHAPAIEQLRRDGLELGCSANEFCPDAPVTRAQVATFLVKARTPQVSSLTAPRGSFHDVSPSNPHAGAIEQLAVEGVTHGCAAPAVGYRIDGYPLTRLQRAWILYFAGDALPRLAAVYGDRERALDVASRAIWWSLKEGVFGHFDDPFRHSVCRTSSGMKHLGAFDTCSGDWQFGLVASEIPDVGEDEVRQGAMSLYPGSTEDEVAIELVSLGRELSRLREAGAYPHDAEEKVLNDTLLRRSWLARDPAIGAYAIIDDIERDCVFGEAPRCFRSMPESSRRFAPSKETATRVQADIRAILEQLGPR